MKYLFSILTLLFLTPVQGVAVSIPLMTSTPTINSPAFLPLTANRLEVSKKKVSADEKITYTLHYHNSGDSAHNWEFVEYVDSNIDPNSFEFLSGPTGILTNIGEGYRMAWVLPFIPSKGSGIIRYSVKVKISAQFDTIISTRVYLGGTASTVTNMVTIKVK